MKFTKLLPIISTLGLLAAQSNAAYVFSGLTITENFDLLPTTAVSGVFPSTVGSQAAISGTEFVGTKLSGSGNTATSLGVDNGNSNSGGIYSYGATSVAERALGSIASGTNVMGFGFELVNGGSDTVSEITISFTQENWRTSTTSVNTIAASYATGAAGSTSFLTAASGFTSASDLSLVGPAVVVTNGPLDGNLVANQVSRTLTITGLSIAAGNSFYLRWQDVNETGNDASLALEGLTISAVTVPEPASAFLGAIGLLGLLRRRR